MTEGSYFLGGENDGHRVPASGGRPSTAMSGAGDFPRDTGTIGDRDYNGK
jgi:hypothetical protein